MKRVGIIAASGRSSRTGLGEYTTKAALPLLGRPLLLHQLEFLHRSGHDLVFVVCQPAHARLLAGMLGDELRRRVAFIAAESAGGWADKVERALPFLSDDDEVAIVPCDNYQTVSRIEPLVKNDTTGFSNEGALFSYTTAWENTQLTDGPVFGRRDGEKEWCEQPGRGFTGDLFTGYVVARASALRQALRGVGLSARGEREITSLLAALRAKPVPYDGVYVDIADLQALARLDALLVSGVDDKRVTIGAGVLPITSEGGVERVLLTERQDGLGWVPPGGLVDGGETYARAAVRELREEIGMDADERGLRLLGVYPAIGKGGEPACSVIFRHRVTAFPAVTLARAEVRSARWFTREQAAELTIPFGLGKAVSDHFDGKELDCR
jgi:8-oxo-dGTP diphosphatase